MSCKYCDIKMRPLDEDTKILKGESWKDELGYEGGYIGPSHDDKFRMVVNYDAGFASTGVPNVKFCPFCGEELKLLKEPLVKDEKIRKFIRDYFEIWGWKIEKWTKIKIEHFDFRTRIFCDTFEIVLPKIDELDICRAYTIAELCGEEEEQATPIERAVKDYTEIYGEEEE